MSQHLPSRPFLGSSSSGFRACVILSVTVPKSHPLHPHRRRRHPSVHPRFRALWTSPVALRKRAEPGPRSTGGNLASLPHTPSVRAVSFQKCLASAASRGTCWWAGCGSRCGEGLLWPRVPTVCLQPASSSRSSTRKQGMC